MSGELTLLVETTDGVYSRLASGVAVTIEPISSEENDPKAPWTVLVPVGPLGLSVEVDPGSYRLQAWLPSGQIVHRSAVVTGERATSVVLRESARAMPSAGSPGDDFDLTKEYHPHEFQPAFSAKDDPFADEGTFVAVDFLGERSPERTWAALSTDFDQAAFSEVRDLATIPIDPHGAGAHRTVIFSRSALQEERRHRDPHERYWIRARHPAGDSISILPLAWLSNWERDPNCYVEAMFESTKQRLEVSIRGSELNSLVSYLKLGRLSAAQISLDVLLANGRLIDVIREKRTNPLAACAAAYISLAVSGKSQVDKWRDWAPNLMNWFPWMPDGAIIRACLMMEKKTDGIDQKEILNLAKEAYRRGLPFFTVGLNHLREIFLIYGGDDAEAREMLDDVRLISSRCDVGEAFTTLQFYH